MRKIVGRTVGTTIPKPNWGQNDPRKGDYIKGKELVDNQIAEALKKAKESGEFDGKTPVKGVDYLTEEDKNEIKNEVLSAEAIVQIQNDIADLKYVPIEITRITHNKLGTKELGTVVDDVTVSWELNKTPKSQTLAGEAVDVTARSKTIPGPFSTGKSFALEVTDERGATDSASTSISFLNGVYYGVLEAGTTLDSAAVLTLTRRLQSTKALTFTVDAGANQRIAFAIPTRYGTPTFNVGGFDGGFPIRKTFDFTNASGYTESYDLWLSENVGLGSTTIKVT